MSTFYTVEIPHTRPARVIEWPDRDEALRCYRNDLRGKVYAKIEASAAFLYMEANSRVAGTLDRGDGESDLQYEAPCCPSGDCTGDAYYGTEGMEASTRSKPDPEGLIRCDRCDGLWDITGQEVESAEDVRDSADAAVFEAAGDDLSSFHTFESLKELDEWSRKYASDSRPGGCGGHQSATIRAQVEEILEDSLAEVMGHEGQEDAPEISTVQDAIDAIEAFTVGSVNGWGSEEFSFEQQLQDQRRHFARYKAAQVFLHSLEGEHASTPPRKHSTPEDRLTMIHDPGHGWLVVPIADVEASGIEVSAHSYKDKANFYLEEDKDAVAYLVACGYKFGPEHRDHIDIEHRHYKSIGFDTGAVRCVEEN